MDVVSWGDFVGAEPDLGKHVAARIATAPCFFATTRKDGWPRVHPVGPLVPRGDALIVTMYPTSPKAHDLRRNEGRYALHGPVEDVVGGGGEVLITGIAEEREPTEADVERGYMIFELLIGSVAAIHYEGADHAPVRALWKP